MASQRSSLNVFKQIDVVAINLFLEPLKQQTGTLSNASRVLPRN